MTIILRDGANTPRTITDIQVRDGTNTPRVISEIWVRDSNNVPRMVFSLTSPMSVEITPSTVSGVSSGTGTATTDGATAVPTGGTGPYTYLWTIDTFDLPPPPTINTPTAASTTLTQTGLSPGGSSSAQGTCTVTDSMSNTAFAEWSAFFLDF